MRWLPVLAISQQYTERYYRGEGLREIASLEAGLHLYKLSLANSRHGASLMKDVLAPHHAHTYKRRKHIHIHIHICVCANAHLFYTVPYCQMRNGSSWLLQILTAAILCICVYYVSSNVCLCENILFYPFIILLTFNYYFVNFT